MRHTPTALYIDTQVFVQNGCRVDTQSFTRVTGTFVKGGIRLLLPAFMERELLRKFSEQASKAAEKLINAHKTYPIASLSLMDIPPEDELDTMCYEEMTRKWDTFKEHFIVEELPLVGNLEDVVDQYFRIKPPFSKKKSKEFPDAFILSALEYYYEEHKANIAVVSGDGDFKKACVTRRFIKHFPSLDEYVQAFEPELKSKDLELLEIDPTKPITTEDLTELKAILGRGSKPTSIEINRVLDLLKSRGTNYEYFFGHATDGIWLEHLISNGYFDNPPAAERTQDGGYRTPFWPPINYLIRVYEAKPDAVLELLEKLPITNNSHILESIMDVVLKGDSVEAVNRLSSKILSYIDHSIWRRCDKIIELLKKPFLFDKALAEFTPLLLSKLVGFLPDPNTKEKQDRRAQTSEDWTIFLEPMPRSDQWDYQQILENGVRPLTDRAAYQVAVVLINATASMLRLSTHQEDLDEEGDEDLSEIWCQRLHQTDPVHEDIKATLIHTLTFACEKVYEKSPESVGSLDETLRNQHWKVFKRLRQHLHALRPNEQTLPWVREFILEHQDYAKWDHHFEFQQMVRKACEHFGADLLNEEERTAIFDAILSGPPKDNFHEWMGDQFTEEKFRQRQRYFHRSQLRPFARLLTGEYQSYFQELESESSDNPITDNGYPPYLTESGSGTVSYSSPISPEDLAELTDQDLLTYINEWQEERHDENNWLVEINIRALAGAFQTVFKDSIIHDKERLVFWMNKDNAERIERPVYVNTIIQAIQEHVKEQFFEQLDLWFGFCEWVLSHPDTEHEEGVDPSEKSREHPDWRSSRRAVQDFVATCIEKDMNVPFSARKSLAKLLELLCTQFDRRLDRVQPVFLNRDDPITEAINNTRSNALQTLFKFGFWIRKHDSKDTVSEVTSTLEARLKSTAEWPLTMPERAMLGMNFDGLRILNQTWAIEYKANFFPQNDLPAWIEAFGNFLRFNHPSKPTFEILKQEFAFALKRLTDLAANENQRMELIDRLGQHLFTYYLWQIYPLNGNDSLLEKFYDKTTGDRQRWARLFDHVGRSLRNSGTHLDEGLEERIIAFFDWRLEAEEPKELAEFTFWLQAKCLAPDWRLDAYSKTLDTGHAKDVGISIVLDSMNDMLENHTAKVVECFAKITDAIGQGNRLYIQTEKAKPILVAGLRSEDESVRKNSESARENLLRDGRFDILDIDE